MESFKTRRDFLRASAVVGTGLVLSSCAGSNTKTSGNAATSATPVENKLGGEVTATEDLMREHGVLRRALLVYSATAIRLRGNPASITPDALQKTAKLFKA